MSFDPIVASFFCDPFVAFVAETLVFGVNVVFLNIRVDVSFTLDRLEAVLRRPSSRSDKTTAFCCKRMFALFVRSE